MSNPTSWYYDSHKREAFPHQKQLCDAVSWTTCNLEGAELKSPDTLSATLGNPLTIRLLALDEALKHFNNAKKIAKRIKKLARAQVDNNKFCAMSGEWEASGSSLNTMGAPIEVIKIKGERFELRYIDIQLALYEFFTNFGSIIDRLTYEIDKLYNLKIPLQKRCWGELVNEKKNSLSILRGKDKNLADSLVKFASKFEMATKYRNRLVHDGIIKVEVNISVVKLGVMLAENPNDDNSSMNVDAIEFCENIRIELIDLLEESYQMMFQHFQTYGKPP